jgi:uncharacterized protein YecE (DUF72 family)
VKTKRIRPASTDVRIGLAGWSNPPSHRKSRKSDQSHLEYYAGHFSCVEINSSFYRPHRAATYAAWKLATPGAFRFAVKMPASITHESGLRGTSREMTQFFAGIDALQPKLGVVLIQLPGRLEFQRRLAKAFFRSVPRLPKVELVCEPRHASWFTEAADAQMAESKVSRVAADPARAVNAGLPGGADGFAYFRWHGSPHMYYSSYSRVQLDAFATQVVGRRRAWCVFDNTARYAAWDNAISFARLLGKGRPAKRLVRR